MPTVLFSALHQTLAVFAPTKVALISGPPDKSCNSIKLTKEGTLHMLASHPHTSKQMDHILHQAISAVQLSPPLRCLLLTRQILHVYSYWASTAIYPRPWEEINSMLRSVGVVCPFSPINFF